MKNELPNRFTENKIQKATLFILMLCAVACTLVLATLFVSFVVWLFKLMFF